MIKGQQINFADVIDGLAPGIDGYIIAEGDTVYLPHIEVHDPGKGRCQAYLAQLEARYKAVKVPTVLSSILEHILKKRGYKLTIEHEPDNFEVFVWVKRCSQEVMELNI